MCLEKKVCKPVQVIRLVYAVPATRTGAVAVHAEGEYSDLIVEQGLLQDDDLQAETMVMPFHCSVDQALDSLNGNGRIGE